ncbi:glutathione ABC transporter substrate-binding protein [Sporolactobacillus terrae]|uniref:Glutathione-binding protein GsiB n=1 Tax=Sporolactobacillus terrae TaxID=269673 RepID=A0ABX5Q4T3_9BACL|nr:glutathione ABC transporter substrate-binding protein [Sporolactobacillus terrae]QAA21661.1 glutathione ABC transporter substrate-binding protein GsiB [Sporolactobacillus terrae]QAA24633.1 glutathione ABC transporter substrate-binding protein GsiB [Sporolactobacillus terrae]UAK16469.1 glutathione ABC transporter substrate-binding protein [Sporolactobacillus terrae]
MKKIVMYMFAVFCLFGFILAGCGTDKGGSSKAVSKNGKDIVVGLDGNFISLDPQDTNDNLSYTGEKTMFEGLVGFDKDMKVIPVLATSYKASDDAKTFTFKLRKDVKFQDGTPFNAEAVKFNFDRVSDPKSTLKRHSLFAIIKETKVIDEYTVQFKLSDSFGAMINTFAHPAGMIVSPTAVKKYGKDFMKHPVGTGPYKFKSWTQGGDLKVVKNTDYWKKGQPKLNSITFTPIPEDGARVAKLQTGEADLIFPVPLVQAKKLDGKNGIDIHITDSIRQLYMSMNTMKKPFNDVKVRQALNYAVDKEAYQKVVLNGIGSEIDSVIAPKVQFYEKQTPYDYDLSKAKQLLREAGYPNGFSATIWSGNSSEQIKAMEFLQQQLGKINVKLKVVPMETGTMANKIWSVSNPDKAEIELYYGGWSPSTGDADWAIRPLLGGSSLPPASYNTAYYKDTKADALINQGLQSADSTIRGKAYAALQKKIWNDAPWVYLATQKNVVGVKSYLKNMYVLPDGTMNLNNGEIVD